MRLKTADASRIRPAARARTAGGRSFAGNGARQDFPFFSVRNNRHFAGKDKFPFLAQTVVFLQARRGAERRIWATRRERNGRAAQQGRGRPERHRRRWKRRRIDRRKARPGKRINARRMRRGWQEMRPGSAEGRAVQSRERGSERPRRSNRNGELRRESLRAGAASRGRGLSGKGAERDKRRGPRPEIRRRRPRQESKLTR